MRRWTRRPGHLLCTMIRCPPKRGCAILHYALDRWVRQRQRRHAAGRMRLVRCADDFVPTFRSRSDAHRMKQALGTRLAKLGLALSADRTRLIEFGCKAAERHRRGSGRRPETFDFLGFMRSDPTGTIHGASQDPAPADDGEAQGAAARHAAANARPGTQAK